MDPPSDDDEWPPSEDEAPPACVVGVVVDAAGALVVVTAGLVVTGPLAGVDEPIVAAPLPLVVGATVVLDAAVVDGLSELLSATGAVVSDSLIPLVSLFSSSPHAAPPALATATTTAIHLHTRPACTCPP